MGKARVAEVTLLVADYVEFDWFSAEAVLPEHALAFGEAVPGWFVLVEQVAAEKDEVDLFLLGDFESFFEGDKRVRTAFRVFLHEAEVVVCGDEDLEDVAGVPGVDLVDTAADRIIGI